MSDPTRGHPRSAGAFLPRKSGRLALLLLACGAVIASGSEAAAAWVNRRISGPLVAGGDVHNGYRISPDGRRVVYLADQDTDGAWELYSVATAGGPVTKLNAPLAAGRMVDNFKISPDGSRVVYLADQDSDNVYELYSVPIAGGVPLRLNAPLAAGRMVDSFKIGPDGSRVVYVADQTTDDVKELFSVPITGGPATKLNANLVAGGDVSSYSFLFSPDGSRVVFSADQDSDDMFELYSCSTFGGGYAKLNAPLAAGTDVSSFRISPNGNRVVYDASRTDHMFELFSVPIGGGAVAMLNDPLPAGWTLYSAYAISPDGLRVVYIAGLDTDELSELYSVPIAGGVVTKLVASQTPKGRVYGFAIGPDGRRVAYVSDQETDDVFELYSVPIAGGALTKLNPPLFAWADVDYEDFRFSPDGSRVLYFADRYADDVQDLFSVPAAGGTNVWLNSSLAAGDRVGSYAISPDSARVVMNAGGGEIYSVSITGGATARVNGPLAAGGYVRGYQFSPDGRRVVYLADQRAYEVQELFAAQEMLSVRLLSQGSLDGIVIESPALDGRGASVDRSSTNLAVGDNVGNQQLRSVISFDTSSLPDNAALLGATLRLRRVARVGTNPFLTHGRLLVDVHGGAFSGNKALQPGDFQAAASRSGAATVGMTVVRGWHIAGLGPAARSVINRAGLTQMRLRFERDDNDDRGTDQLRFASGDAGPSLRPVLEIFYTQP